MIDLSARWVPSQQEFDDFAAVSGDDNQIHVDPEFSARTTFGRTVSHGMLIYAKLWGMVLRHNPDCRQIHQSLMFPNPCFAGEEITLSVRGMTPGSLTLTASRSADGAVVLNGEARIA